MGMSSIFWLVVIVIAVVVEACTVQLVSIWMVAGGIGALIADLCGAPFWIQTAIFAGVTALALVISRPMVKKVMHFQKVDTNAGRYIGKTGIVTAQIDNTEGVGQVTVLGSVWTARSSDGSILPEGENVVIKAIEGVKLIVEPERRRPEAE
ncbi:NfeD family protein [Anaeromassilibacillus sp. SJQ-1]|uniref:NfeD family protein n=1 Tax=Anaeromassilibacillus sp. SJQ-1 TaxID=3375419 RepID=UPI0039899DEE